MLKAEVERVLHIKTNKVPGLDEIPTEILKALGNDGEEIILDLCNKIWQIGK